MSGDAPINADSRASQPVGRVTLERLLTHDEGSVAPAIDVASRLSLPPQPDEDLSPTQDDALLLDGLLEGRSLIAVSGEDERARAQLVLRLLREESAEGRVWLWAELGVSSSALHVFEALFGLLHIPVPYGLTQLLRRVDEEDSIDCSLSDEALEEYELAREILCSSLLMRRASGLALHLHSHAQDDDPELKLLMRQLEELSGRVPVIMSAARFPRDVIALEVKSHGRRALPSLSGYEQDGSRASEAWASDELLMTLTFIHGAIHSADLLALAPPSDQKNGWKVEALCQRLIEREYLKQIESGGYLVTSQGREQGATLLQQSRQEDQELRERRFVRCFARYGQEEEILKLDGEAGGTWIDRYIEVKPHLEGALDVAIAYGWEEAASLALGISAIAERHGPAMLAQRPLVLALRVPLSEPQKLALELKLTILQPGGDQRLSNLESYKETAARLQEPELYVELSYYIAREYQRRGESLTAYRLLREVKERYDQRVSEPNMIQVLNTLGWACFVLQRDDEAYDHLTYAVERARTAGSLRLQARALTSLGVYYSRRGEHLEAKRSHQAAINIHQHLKSYFELCPSLCNLADAYRLEGLYHESLRLFERSMKVSVAFGNHSTLALVWANLGEAQLAVGQLEEAEASLQRGIQLLKERGTANIAAIFLGVLGYLYGVHHEFSRASEAHLAFTEGDELLDGVFGFEGERAKLWLKWGLARIKWGQLDDAARAYHFALQLTSNHVDVELQRWFDLLRSSASSSGLTLPPPQR